MLIQLCLTKSFQNNIMSLGELFQDIHGALDRSKLIPLRNLIGGDGLPTTEQFYSVVELLDIDADDIYYNPSSFLDRFVYLSKFIYFPLYDFSIEGLKMINPADKLKKMHKAFEELEKQKDYISIFEFMEKKLLIPTYIQIFDQIPNDQKYEIFVSLHIRSEFGFDMFTNEFLKKIFSFRKFSKEYPKRMRKLKAKVTGDFIVYHGNNKNYNPKDEYSWTLKLETAKFFANRFDNKGKISKKKISIENVIDFFDQRGEDEIIILTDNLK